ncbi:glutamate receptor ionotropic, delta-2-like [Macrobrachium rosenbergii]|uniref:glutamate receptor ionotropic, delta-2-like n=1 Tax=Macrobrachium rosenbergii TaxID=79674 RepID=UPI0034D638CA
MNIGIYLRIVIFLTSLLDSVDCVNTVLAKISVNNSQELSTTQKDPSETLSTDIQTIIEELSKDPAVHFQILYDEQHEETTSTVFKKMPAGLTMFRYERAMLLRQLLKPSSSGVTFLLTLCSPQNILDVFQKIRNLHLESHWVRWILMMEGETERDGVMAGLDGILNEGTQVAILTRNSAGHLSVFTSRLTFRGTIGFAYRGVWEKSSREGARRLRQMVTSDDLGLYKNMRGRTLTVTALNVWPFFALGKQYPDGSYEAKEGIDVRIVDTLSSALNFTYRVVRPSDGAWGYPQPDGTVTGMIGMVSRREAHLAITIIAINEKREEVVDFTIGYYRGLLKIYSRAPRQKNRALAVMSSFDSQVWICIMATTLVMGPLAYLASVSLDPDGKEGLSLKKAQEYSFGIFSNLVLQDNRITPVKWPEKVIFLSWYLFCLVVSALYSGMLTAVLAVPSYEKPVESLEDLPRAVKDGFTIGVMADSTNEYLFRDATFGIYKDTWKLFNHEDRSKSFVDGPATGIARVLERKFIYMGPAVLGDAIAKKYGSNKFHFGKETFFPQDAAIACPPGAPYVQSFNRVLTKLVEGGLNVKWEKDEIRKIPEKRSDADGLPKISAITITHLQAAFFIVVLGILVSAAVLLMENVCFFLILV